MIIATHDGTFHADETTACAIISYLHDKCSFIRSRDPDELERGDIVIDVSSRNDEKHYDHHSKDFKECRENGIRYATAGLMWRKFGEDYLKKVAAENLKFHPSARVFKHAFERIDREIMCAIDLDDNGQLTCYLAQVAAAATPGEEEVRDRLAVFYEDMPTISYLVAMQNVPNADRATQDQAFVCTVRTLKLLLVSAAINALHTEAGIAKVLDLYQGEEILVLRDRLPWTEAVLTHPERFENCKLAVYPDRQERWRVQSLPRSKAQRFKNRLGAPLEWRGLNDRELAQITGVATATFVHRSGFTGGAVTFEDNLKLAQLWLKLGVPD
ncbi:MAG: MYG1 family protein [Succinivibrio sp.]|nr:MYG1 family protein [Succinivibrio sp.]